MKRSSRAGVLSLMVFFATGSALGASGDFTVLHCSDTHFGPYLDREGAPGAVRGAETIAWMAREAGQGQALAGRAAPAAAPEFAIVTGDITEYGVIDRTWEIAERTLNALPCPWYAVPGNHDNTWVALYDVMRRRHGGANHALDHAGWHFVMLCSASPQEPVPSLDATTRAWLRGDLARLAPGTPIVIALHHSPEIGEYANPAEMDTFLDLVRDYNVQLLLVGHGHSPRAHDVAGIPAIEGGSTFGGNAGYGLLSIGADRVRYDYRRFPGTEKAAGRTDSWEKLYDAPVQPRRRHIDLAAPAADLRVRDGVLPVQIRGVAGGAARAAKLTIAVDGVDRKTMEDVALSEAGNLTLPTDDLVEGAHLLTVRVLLADAAGTAGDRDDLRTRVFHVERGLTEVRWRLELPAAIKAAPVVVGDRLVVAGTDGVVRAFDAASGAARWSVRTGGEILGTPAWSGELLVFGSGDGTVRAVDAAGGARWQRRLERPVYGPPLVADGTVYVGDNGGRMHALALADGNIKWTFERADYAIESAAAVWGDALCFGAWDGYLYCLKRADGSLRWRQLGPKSSVHKAFRYYAPADAAPVAVGERLFVCDRGYHLGIFGADGVLARNEALQVSALSPADTNGWVYARQLDDRVRKLDAQGATLWQIPAPTGRFPIPPTVHGGRVYVCANSGRLTVLDAHRGATIWTYQATPGFYVMAPVAVAADGTCFVAGMDGSVTAVGERRR